MNGKLTKAGSIVGVLLCCGWLGAQWIHTAESQIYQKLANMTGDMRLFRTGLETYFIDNNSYPRFKAKGGAPDDLPTFAPSEYDSSTRTGAISLTTPIAYISKLPPDQLAQDKPYGYITTGGAWLMWSRGPDQKSTMDWAQFDPAAAKQSPDFHATYSYDSTNGLVSSGDLWFTVGDSTEILEKMLEQQKKAATKAANRPNLSLLGAAAQLLADAAKNSPEGKSDEVLKNTRIVATALETYAIDNNAYPAFTTAPQQQIGPNPLPAGVPTFHRYVPPTDKAAFKGMLFTLTTPVSYLREFPQDPYAPAPAPYAYIARGTSTWMLWSPGPDGKYDVDLDEFTSETRWPAPNFLAKFSYDPSNGAVSPGDIIRLKQ